MIKRNLRHLIDSATEADVNHGLEWYRKARIFAFEASRRHGVPFIKVCAVIAALSPRNKWERNKIDAERVIHAVSLGNQGMPRCCTYGAMVRKAVDCLNAEKSTVGEMLRILNGHKISAFFLNIYDGENERVTVDSWIHQASNLEYLKTEERPALKKSEYREIETSIRELSVEYNLKPYQTQAIIWVSFKRKTETKKAG